MPRKIRFSVFSSSSHEEKFSAEELLVQAPTARGWRSSRLCSFPQSLTLRLEERSRVRKLQVLSHQFMIPSRVELHIGDGPGEDHMRRLGYVSLSENEETSFKARELKSVHVDAAGTFLRLTLHRNHGNRHNRYNQVSLVAVNVLGDSVDSQVFNTAVPGREQLMEQYLGASRQDPALDSTSPGKWDMFSPLDDLAFDMYQDPEVAQIIRLLDQSKQEKVHQENFEQARHLKQAIADLQKVGERLARLDIEKLCALEKEDFAVAEVKKQQMDQYRRSVYQQLEQHGLLQTSLTTSSVSPRTLPSADTSPTLTPPSESPQKTPTRPHPTVPSESPQKTPRPHPTVPAESPLKTRESNPQPPGLSPEAPPSLSSGSSGSVTVPIVPYDERPLPALSRPDKASPAEEKNPVVSSFSPGASASPPIVSSSPPEAPSAPPGVSSIPPGVLSPPPGVSSPPVKACISGEPEPLSEKALREAGNTIDVFGETIVCAAFSKNWSYREDALSAVHQRLLETSASKDELRGMIRAAVILVRKSLQDQVSSVFLCSLKLLRLLLSELIPKTGLGRSEITHCLDQTWPHLLSRTGDSGSRPRLNAVAFIQDLALLKEVRSVQWIPPELVRPLGSSVNARQAQSRAELVLKLLPTLGFEISGFTLDSVLTFSVAALGHSAPGVRDRAVQILLCLYPQYKTEVLRFFPPKDHSARKKFIYRSLFDGFKRIDGAQADAQETEEQEEEIQSLQEELSALNEITAGDEKQDETKAQSPKRETVKEEETEETEEMEEFEEMKQTEETEEIQKTSQTGSETQTRTETLSESQNETPAVVQEGPQGDSAPAAEVQETVGHYLDNLCIFCGRRDETFTDDGLDLHYWKHCPMLRRCDHCKQVVEICSLTEHLLGECEARSRFSQCPQCSEAVTSEDLKKHMDGPTCHPASPGIISNHCPLCHGNFSPGDEAWKTHLMSRDGCKYNPRRPVLSPRTQPTPGRFLDRSNRARQSRTVGPRARPLGRGSKIPALAPTQKSKNNKR